MSLPITTLRLYLDFDGVLHRFAACNSADEAERLGHFRRCADGGRIFWAPTHFEHLPALTVVLSSVPDLEIYVHSSWRYLWQEQRPAELVEWLGPLGEKFVRFVPSSIRGSRHDVIRGDMYHDKFTGPWVAVDDEDDGFTGAGAHAHFVKCDPHRGLGDAATMRDLTRKLQARRQP